MSDPLAEAGLPEPVRELGSARRDSLAALVARLAADPTAPSSVRDSRQAWRVHVADSLSGLAFSELAGAGAIADLGAGAGFPGLVLAVALPTASVDLVESVRRKCEFMARSAAEVGIPNATVVCERSETWAAGEGRGRYEAVTARAVGRLATLAELASPLLADDGVLVAWKGRRDPDEEAELARAAERVAMRSVEIRWVGPFAGSRHRHLHLIRKTGPAPPDLPRRPGVAKRRPFGS